MACLNYTPKFKKQLDGSRYAGLNCTAASAAMAADYHTCGSTQITPSQVRTWTGDTSGGLNLAQVDTVLQTHVNVNLDTRYRLPWADFVTKINRGQGAILQGWYKPIEESRFAGSKTFGGNHAIFVPPGWGAMDPLADGRRSEIYSYHGEPYPQPLLKDFAGRLNVGGSAYRALGSGLVYAAFTRDNQPDYYVKIRPIAPATTRSYYQYNVSNGVITSRTKRYTEGFLLDCTPPKLFSFPSSSTSVSLVRITGGTVYAGRYVSSAWAHEV